MSGAEFFSRNLDSSAVKEDLLSHDPERQIQAVKQVIAYMTVGKDMSSHFSDVANMLSSNVIEIKKLVYLYLMQNAKSQPEKAVLQAGVFVHDTMHDSPLIRGMALRTMSSLQITAMVDFICKPLVRCLRDGDPYVRRCAANAVLKLYAIAPGVCSDVGLLEVLLELLADTVPSVVAAATSSLREILSTGGSLRIAAALLEKASTLVAALPDCGEWGQVHLLDGLGVMFQQRGMVTLEDAESLMGRVVPLLQSGNAGVVGAALRLILSFLMCFIGPHSALTPMQQATVESKYSAKLVQPLITLVTHTRPEIRYVALRSVKLLLGSTFKEVLMPFLSTFFVKFNDPSYIKIEKIDVLLSLATSANATQVLSEVAEYATEIDVALVRKAVRAIGLLAVRVEPIAPQCVERLVRLIDTKVSYIIQEAAVVVQTILRQYPSKYDTIIVKLCEALDVLDGAEAKSAVVWVIGEYAERVDNALEILSLFVESFKEEDLTVQLATLTATVKMFLKASEATSGANREVLEKVLSLATASDSPDLRDRAHFYWRLVVRDPAGASRLLLGPKPAMVEAPPFDRALLTELLMQFGSMAAVYHKPFGMFAGKDHVAVMYDESDDDAVFIREETGAVAAPVLDDLMGERESPVPPQVDRTAVQRDIDDMLVTTSPRLTKVLDAATGHGLETSMSWETTGGGLQLVCRFALAANAAIATVTLTTMQLNSNVFGLTLGRPLPVTVLPRGGDMTLSLPIAARVEAKKKPLREVQVALKTEPLGVIFFVAPPVPVEAILQPAGACDPRYFADEFKRLPPTWGLPHQGGPNTTLTPQGLKPFGFSVVHHKQGGATTYALLFATTLGGQKLFIELAMTGGVVTTLSIRGNDPDVSEPIGEYLVDVLRKGRGW